jgi:diaminopimelate epimerase
MDFMKYHGLGNDFIIIGGKDAPSSESECSVLARRLCARRLGIGADGLIIVRENPLEMVIYNSDGSRAPMCGNGIRCFAHYCHGHGIVPEDKSEYEVQTLAGTVGVRVQELHPFRVEVDMGKPVYAPEKLGMKGLGKAFLKKIRELPSAPTVVSGIVPAATGGSVKTGRMVEVSSVFTGTVHTVLWVGNDGSPGAEDIGGPALWSVDAIGGFEAADRLETIGRLLSEHPAFPEKTNVNFARTIDRKSVEMLTFVRGAALTAACGTGACAVAAIGFLEGRLDREVTMHLPFGALEIRLCENGNVLMSGPSEFVARGSIEKSPVRGF